MILLSVPPPIQIVDLVTDEPMKINGSCEPWPMYRYLAMWVIPDPALGVGFEADMIRHKILQAFRFDGYKDPTFGARDIELDDEWIKRMHRAVTSPAEQIPAWAAVNLLPFQQAVVEAWTQGGRL